MSKQIAALLKLKYPAGEDYVESGPMRFGKSATSGFADETGYYLEGDQVAHLRELLEKANKHFGNITTRDLSEEITNMIEELDSCLWHDRYTD